MGLVLIQIYSSSWIIGIGTDVVLVSLLGGGQVQVNKNQYDKVVKRHSECCLYKLTGAQADRQAAPGIERLRL
jgi:hypothetical protein